MNDVSEQQKEQLNVLHRMMHVMVGSYAIGWGLLVLYTRNVPILHDHIWRTISFVILLLTVWLALTLSLRALVWWSAATTIVATLRSIGYVLDGYYGAVAVWMLILSGIAVTTLAIISVKALTGRLPKETD